MKIKPRNHLEEFTSINGILMVKGINFNWSKIHKYRDETGPYFLQVSFNIWSYTVANYHYYEDKHISISKQDNSLQFYANNLLTAENLVLSFAKANGLEIAPLYLK